MRKALLIVVVAAVLALMAGFAIVMLKPSAPSTTPSASTSTPSSMSGKKKLVVFCAGSLYIPLQEVKKVFEEKYPDVEVIIEPSGSVKAVRKVTELKRRCDVLAVADYRLIPKYMMPDYASWCIAFASNKLVLCYTNHSKYADQINAENWYEILSKPDVKYGFSNPNDDPCGYRSVIALGLASLLYGKDVLGSLVLSKTNIKAEEVNGALHIYVPADLEVHADDLVIRSKSVDLIALLEAGALDYAFEYKSVAVQHKLKYIELPAELNLGDPKHKDFYDKVVIHILCGTDKEKEIPGAPIVYGVTIPSTAENKEYAVKFVQLLLSDTGKKIFEGLGQPFLEKPLYIGEVPAELQK